MPVEIVRAPIDAELLRQHRDRAAAVLPEYDADGLLIFRDTNILGFCGVPLAPTDRLVCALLNRDGAVGFIVPAFEAAIADGILADNEIFDWREHEDPYATVAKAAKSLGLAGGTILLDPHTWLDASTRLVAHLPGTRLIPDPGVIESVRITKSPDELAIVREACRDTGRIFAIIKRLLRRGITERDLRREAYEHLNRAGVTPFGELIQGGESAAIPHQPTSDRRFREGDAVIVDFAAYRGGYLGDMTRTFAIGEMDEDIRRAYAIVREAQKAAIAAVRPGVTCESVDQVARAIIEDAGLGDYFSHRLGHGVGLNIHEPPYLVRGNRQPLAAGMCVTVEPGVYVPGRYGIRIEDVVAVTDDGCEVLTSEVPTDMSEEFA
ncbi:MAG TPA: Xaa-Pro peptidase family protein [Phycisphaerae bacterium]|nr:Xaa-Pro peptidase family protein [Phycisphaerae bacterium]